MLCTFLLLVLGLRRSLILSGREESDPDDKLLADTDLDRSSPQVERVRFRRNKGHQVTLPEGVEAGHSLVQQVSPGGKGRHSSELIPSSASGSFI